MSLVFYVITRLRGHVDTLSSTLSRCLVDVQMTTEEGLLKNGL